MSDETDTIEVTATRVETDPTLPTKIDAVLLAAEEPDANVDLLCEAIMRIDAMKAWLREREATFKAIGKAWCERNGRGFSFGTKEYFLGTDKKEQARDAKVTLETLLSLTGGDVDTLCGFLSANAWKPGAIRKYLKEHGVPAKFNALFETTVKTDLKTKALVRELQEVETKFLPRG